MGNQGSAWPGRGRAVGWHRWRWSPSVSAQVGLLSEVGSPSEVSHCSLSHSSFQQPHARSHSHHCPWTIRQASPAEGQSLLNSIYSPVSRIRAYGGSFTCDLLGFGEKVLLLAHWSSPEEHFSFLLQCNGSAHIIPKLYLFKGGEPPCCLQPPSPILSPSTLPFKSHAAKEEAPVHAQG